MICPLAIQIKFDTHIYRQHNSSAERADGIAAEPLRDVVLVEGVGVGHRPKRLLVLGDEVLQADGALVPRARAARHLPQPQYGLISGGDATTLAAAGGHPG
jgi:hypothetical protein